LLRGDGPGAAALNRYHRFVFAWKSAFRQLGGK